MFRLEMKGVVPQKGFKIKLSINPGPYNGGTNFGFTISTDNCKILSNVLWDWYHSLPEIGANTIDITTVNIDKCANGELIRIKVILFGEKDPQNQIEMSIFNYTHCKLIESEEKFKNILNEKLEWFLKRKIEAMQKTETFLISFSEAMSKK